MASVAEVNLLLTLGSIILMLMRMLMPAPQGATTLSHCLQRRQSALRIRRVDQASRVKNEIYMRLRRASPACNKVIKVEVRTE